MYIYKVTFFIKNIQEHNTKAFLKHHAQIEYANTKI